MRLCFDPRISSYLVFAAMVATATACGDDGGSTEDADLGEEIDGSPVIDADLSGACSNSAASYLGVLENPTATNEGQELVFFVDIDRESPPDRLRLRIDDAVVDKEGQFTLPDANWSAVICLDDSDGSCSDTLEVSSGSLDVSSAVGRFQASIGESTFVDDLAAPTCTATVGALSFDVSIDALP